jgi:hypothetical protein
MATYTKAKLSGSTNGRGILIAATATPGTTLHTAINTAGALDEVWIYLMNNHTGQVTVTLEWGGTTNPDDRISLALSAQSGLVLVVPGLVLGGGVLVRAFAGTANVVSAHGFVNQIT